MLKIERKIIIRLFKCTVLEGHHKIRQNMI